MPVCPALQLSRHLVVLLSRITCTNVSSCHPLTTQVHSPSPGHTALIVRPPGYQATCSRLHCCADLDCILSVCVQMSIKILEGDSPLDAQFLDFFLKVRDGLALAALGLHLQPALCLAIRSASVLLYR